MTTGQITITGLPGSEVAIGNNALLPSRDHEPSYEYSALSYPDSIRVFVLEPSADEEGHLEGKIIEHRLSDSCAELGYNALSYVWGKEKDTHWIHVEGCQLRIGKNLDSALRQLRRKDRPIRLWVDAVCIDQKTVNERNHQVQQMRAIFFSALETIIYLGDLMGGNTEKSAWNFLERRATWAMNQNRDADLALPAEREKMIDFRGEISDVEIEVLERPWFRRLWVFQEVVVSKVLSIQCGGRRISWDDFCKTLLLSPRCDDRYGFSFELSKKTEIVRDMFQIRCLYQELHVRGHLLPPWRSQVQAHQQNSLHVLNVLQTARTLEASDPRDKIFGLLGICSGIDLNDQRFAIDYNQDRETLYTRFTRNIISATKSYNVLSYIDHDLVKYDEYVGREVNVHSLPSWVPDWDLSRWTRHNQPTVLSTLKPEEDLEKVKSHSPSNDICEWDDSGQILITPGSVIGRVDILTDEIQIRSDAELEFPQLRDSEIPDELKPHRVMTLWTNYVDPEDVFHRFLDAKKYSEKGTVEHHLLAGARKMVSWRNNNNTDSLSFAAIDNESIVDGRRIAVYQPAGIHSAKGLAIVPRNTNPEDLLVDLRGGRVPFTIRISAESYDADGDYLSDASDDPVHCRLIGESVVNRMAEDATSPQEKVFMIH
ncbi:heterokaryon incompatibility protein-domain-containing protein [Xylaria bambusicola]|uniref:heterokaryon incompatibility protein-domain-containing protein n=1 Tax=Xylaria bambusicola TaxID=326684 RepID=UPI002007C433|nr:heterokaryon incompatibility protein-domain-containing protein [Xylaria bambusicola]KAI0506495.1 heterokaryon incompatibility protein-domain-containing protein [Xylaria bambusicola]